MKRLLFITLLGMSLRAVAGDLSEQAYCDYNRQKAEAERLLDQSPMVMVGFGRNNTATGNVLAVGVTESLSKFLQGNLSHKIGDADCHLYEVTSEIQKHVSYDIQALQLQQFEQRLVLTNAGIKKIDDLLVDERTRLIAGTTTLQNVASLEAARQTLIIAKTQLEQQTAVIVIPPIGDERLVSLLKLANVYMLEEQTLISKQSKLQNWDINVTIGEGSNPNYPMLRSLPHETFATATFTYSFGAPARSRALDRAADSYTIATMTGVTNPVNLGNLLRIQATRVRDAAKSSLEAYRTYGSSIENQIESIQDADNLMARSFRVQLIVAHVNNDIELEANEFVHTSTNTYIVKNFEE